MSGLRFREERHVCRGRAATWVGSLYLALQRLEEKKWIRAKWGVSENNRRARFYDLMPKGREQLVG